MSMTTTTATDREVLTPLQRWGEVILMAMMLLMLNFFLYHQVMDTGFFTSRFGAVEIICLYGPIILSFAAPITRAWTGYRNPARPFEVITSLALAMAAVWLLRVFPFDFAHLLDPLPAAMRFPFFWLNNDIGRIILLLQIIIGPITALLTGWRYLAFQVRQPTRA
jgi:hypothetical protein